MTTTFATDEVIPHPAAPQTLEESGLSLDLVVQLVLKSLHFVGELSGIELARRLGLMFSVIDPALDVLKQQRQCEIVGGGIDRGRFVQVPDHRLRPKPGNVVPREQPLRGQCACAACAVPEVHARVHRTVPRQRDPRSRAPGVSHLVLSDRVLDQLGPAINAAHSMFVYGPPGNGKTVISQAIRNLLGGEIAIPHALEVEGNIIRLYDPVNQEESPPMIATKASTSAQST